MYITTTFVPGTAKGEVRGYRDCLLCLVFEKGGCIAKQHCISKGRQVSDQINYIQLKKIKELLFSES